MESLLTLKELGAERWIDPMCGGFLGRKDDAELDPKGLVVLQDEEGNLFLRLAGFSGLGGGVSDLSSRGKESQVMFLKTFTISIIYTNISSSIQFATK